jgi:membrane-bound inhibitor of C-type lysozyme
VFNGLNALDPSFRWDDEQNQSFLSAVPTKPAPPLHEISTCPMASADTVDRERPAAQAPAEHRHTGAQTMATRLPLIALTLLLAGCQSSPPPAPAAATKTVAYNCDDGRLVQAGYPDTDTAELAFGGRTHRLHITISGSGARYIGDGCHWWSQGTLAWLAPLMPGESYASAQGVSFRAP